MTDAYEDEAREFVVGEKYRIGERVINGGNGEECLVRGFLSEGFRGDGARLSEGFSLISADVRTDGAGKRYIAFYNYRISEDRRYLGAPSCPASSFLIEEDDPDFRREVEFIRKHGGEDE